MIQIDNALLDELTRKAKESPRLRMNYDLRTSSEDTSQRMLNALEPGTMVPIHRHTKSTEVVVMLRGKGVQHMYDVAVGPDGERVVVETGQVMLEAGGACCAMSVGVGEWHRLEALESGTIIFEAKDGKYEPVKEEDVVTEKM